MSETVRTKIPKSRAKTAYSLLSEICELIIAEPLRYNQERYLTIEGRDEQPPMGFPSCGTVGCVAGWVVAIKGKAASTSYSTVEQVAGKILGLAYVDRMRLFSGSALCDVNTGAGPEPQTVEHAQAGVNHIRKFQKKYRAQLLAKKV